jgi:hypothetical protein
MPGTYLPVQAAFGNHVFHFITTPKVTKPGTAGGILDNYLRVH